MNYFLVKTEPSTYSWERLLKEKNCVWDGVRNYAARLHLRAMKKGDLVLVYHSGDDKAVFGIAKVIREAYPDPTANGEDWSAIDLASVKSLPKHVSFAAIKAMPSLKDIPLVRISRLSVMQLDKKDFDTILAMGNV